MTNPAWGEKAVQMARGGDTIEKIRKELQVDYWEVWEHVRNVQGTEWSSWQGAKWIVSNRLNRLVKERNQAERQKLRDQADECVNYLYDAAKSLSRKVDRARKTLDA